LAGIAQTALLKLPPTHYAFLFPVKKSTMLNSEYNELLARLERGPGNGALALEVIDAFQHEVRMDAACFDEYDPTIFRLLAILFDGDLVKHQFLAPLAAQQLVRKYGLSGKVDETLVKELSSALSQDSLFLGVMEKTYNAHLVLEDFLVSFRRQLLREYSRHRSLSGSYLHLVTALAVQSFNNEYVFAESVNETQLIDELFADWKNARMSTKTKAEEAGWMIYGMYRPLLHVIQSQNDGAASCKNFSENVNAAWQRLVVEPLLEAELKASIPAFGKIANTTSQSVRLHYEENPFPRWLNLNGPFIDVPSQLHRFRASMKKPPQSGSTKKILVAGCGTGQQPLNIAMGNPEADIVAVDLSLSSLAYGKRMAEKHQVTNVTFMHGDILDLAELDQKFSHVESAGVLHCFEDPLIGWQAVESVMSPGATFHVAVYGKLARIPIEYIHKEISRLGLAPSAASMKLFRQSLLNDARYEHIRKFLVERDFFSMSMFRDLLFHQHEYCYTLSELEQNFNSLGFQFLGMDLSHDMAQKYRKLFPDDPHLTSLENWKAFEIHYTGGLSMFRCWLQKPVPV
jgi:ubiquinone/menaquinone biosynthesis C-methylase UbiE